MAGCDTYSRQGILVHMSSDKWLRKKYINLHVHLGMHVVDIVKWYRMTG